MTQDEIIEMAKQAHISLVLPASERALETFAKLVAAKATASERNACAKVIENYPHWLGKTAKTEISNAIRARGEQA